MTSSFSNFQSAGRTVYHYSSGGFLFFEDPLTHVIYVAILRKSKGDYVIPKGHIEEGENPVQAATREIFEELGLTVKPTFVTEIGRNFYSFTLPDDESLHIKEVMLYVFFVDTYTKLHPLQSEGFISADWYDFYTALDVLTHNKQDLLRARQQFYIHRAARMTETADSLSVVIASFNGERTIRNTLLSVSKELQQLKQIRDKHLVICLDHCSDDTSKVVNEVIPFISTAGIKITVMENQLKKGKASAVNSAFAATNTALLCIIDDDVVLSEGCLSNLISHLICDNETRCVFARCRPVAAPKKPIWQSFWYKVFNIKFIIQPYKGQSRLMRGACMMMRRSDFVRLPNQALNEAQFLQYIYWPHTKEVPSAEIIFKGVSKFKDYYLRFRRITTGSRQLLSEFTAERIEEVERALMRQISKTNLTKLSRSQRFLFRLYRFIRYWTSMIVEFQLRKGFDHEWKRANLD